MIYQITGVLKLLNSCMHELLNSVKLRMISRITKILKLLMYHGKLFFMKQKCITDALLYY